MLADLPVFMTSGVAVARADRCWPSRVVQPRPVDNLGNPSATGWQDLHVGQWVPMSPKPQPTERTAFRVDSFEVDRWLLWTKPDSTWSWLGAPTGGRTRLVEHLADPDTGEVVPITLVTDNGSPFRSFGFGAFITAHPELRHVRTRVRSASSSTRSDLTRRSPETDRLDVHVRRAEPRPLNFPEPKSPPTS